MSQDQFVPDREKAVEERLEAVLSRIKEGFYALDHHWRFTYVNDRFCEMVERSPAEILGQSIWNLFREAAGTEVQLQFQRALDEQSPIQFEYFYAQGERWYEYRVFPSSDGLTIFTTDITERKQTELVLLKQKQLLERIAVGQPLEDCLLSVCAAIAQLNPHVRAAFLLADAQRLTFSRSITPDFPSAFGQGLRDAPINDLCIGTCGEAVYRGHSITCADIAKDDRWSSGWRDLCVAHGVLACHSTPVLGRDGQPLGSLMLAFDEARLPTKWEYQLAEFGAHVASVVFERDRANAALHKSETNYRTLFESIDEGFCIVEVLFEADGTATDHRILQANAAFERHTGILDPKGKTASELAPGLEQYWNHFYAQVIHTGETVHIENHSDALDRWFEVLVWRVGDASTCQVAIVFTDITQRKQAEALLRASHDTFRYVVETSPFGVYVIDADFRLAQVSAGAQKVFESIHPLIGRDFAEVLRLLWPEPFASEAIARFRHTLATGEPYHSPSTIERRHDIGEIESYDWKLERLTLPDGRLGVVCHFYDLSERQHYEAALRESEERFRNMADHAPVMVWVTDPTGSCTYLSQSWYDFTGQTAATGLGFGWLSRVHPDDGELAEQTFLNANQRQEPFALEYRLQDKHGEYIWAIDAASPWFGVEGQFKGYIGSVLDISERKRVEDDRKQAEQTLRQSEERYRTLFESIDEGFCVVEMLFDQNNIPIDYRVLEVNPTFEQQTGLHQAVGKTARQLNLEEHWIEIYGQVALTGESVRFENGSETLNRWFDVYACCTGELEAQKVAIVFKDISERKQAEAILQRAAAMDAFRVSLADALRPLVDPAEIQATASRVLGEYLGANRVAYFEVRGADYVVERDYVQGAEALAGGYPIESFGPKLLAAYREGRTVSASEVAADPNLSPEQRSAYAAIQIAAHIAVPLVKGGEFVAGLAVHAAESRVWTLNEIALVEEVAESTWAAVERARSETALRQTSDELERQLRKFAAIATAVPDFIYTFDLAGRFTFVNQPLLDLWQKTLAETLGKNFFELDYPADLAARLQDQIQQVIETRQAIKDETPYTGAVETGVYEYVLVPLLDANGAVEAVAGVTRDITDRKHTEAALRESENRLRLALESAELGTWDFNPVTGVLQWDEQCKAMFGLSPEVEVNYEIFLSGLHPADRDRTDQVVQTSLNPESGGEYDIEYRTIGIEDGVERWITAKGKAFFNPDGLAIRFIGTVLDMTEPKRAAAERERLLQQEQAAREEAERANRIKDEFLAVLSHELRSPLNPILGWTRLLQNGKLDAARQSDALKTIERNAKLQSQLVEDLLDISRIMQGKLSLIPAPVSLTFVISAAVETVLLAAEAKQIQITLDLDSTLPPISGDIARLQQVVWNLLTNAVKFTPIGGQVMIELRQIDQMAQFCITDTGRGIAPQFLPHVFEYFRQEDGSSTRRFGGLGLGLAIVRQIVEMHGGTVQAESQGENRGATFRVQLPIPPQVLLSLPETTRSPAANELPLNQVQILVVDDDPDTREFQAFLLEQSGAGVIAVASGSEALQVLDLWIPDVLVSDVGMAEMDGHRLIQHIRARPPEQGGSIPAIALTAYAAEVDRQKAIQAGFQTHLTKPVEPERLVMEVVSLLNSNSG